MVHARMDGGNSRVMCQREARRLIERVIAEDAPGGVTSWVNSIRVVRRHPLGRNVRLIAGYCERA